MIEWDTTTTALNDMLRDELAQSYIDEAKRCYTEHRANAARFAAAGNHADAMREINAANEYRRTMAYWQQAMESEAH